MSLCRLSDSSIQVMFSRHVPVCCPTAESSYSFEPKQGVAIPLPACPLLSLHPSMVEEQGFKWTGGAVGKVTQHTLLCNHLPFKQNSVVRFHGTGKRLQVMEVIHWMHHSPEAVWEIQTFLQLLRIYKVNEEYIK